MKAEEESAKVEAKPERSCRDLIWEAFQKVLGWVMKNQSYMKPMKQLRNHEHPKVTADQNVGQWLNETYPQRSSFRAVIDRVLFGGPENIPNGLVSMAPNQSENDLRIGLHQLCYGTQAKFGCYLPLLIHIIVFDLQNYLDKFLRDKCLKFFQHLLD